MPIMSVVARPSHIPPRSRTRSSRAASHTCSDSISTPSRSKTTAAGAPTERPYRRACQHDPVPTNDVEAIRALIHDYAERIDLGDLDGLAALFAEATWGSPGRGTPLRGTEQVRRGYDGVILYDGIPCTKHVISNVTIEFADAGATATARSSFPVLRARPALPLQPIIAGR